ncbi:hypothetical protein M569_13708, partial [Genlisea aurea]
MIPLWSFSTGTEIYSSYQSPVEANETSSGIDSHYFIDCGDDWELYVHSGLGKLKLTKTLEEYIASTPQIAENGEVVLGSRKTTTFLVDARTGRVIHTYHMADSTSVLRGNGLEDVYRGERYSRDDMSLYITRTDYTLTSLSSRSEKVLWNLTVAELGAAVLCRDVDESIDVESGGNLSPSDLPYNMPLPCQSRALVYRFRNQDKLAALSFPNGEALYEEKMLQPSSSSDALPPQPHAGKVVDLLTLPGNRSKSESVAVEDVRVVDQKKFGSILLFGILFSGVVIRHYVVVSGIRAKLFRKPAIVRSTPSKRKKPRKGSSSSGGGGGGGRSIGKLFVSDKEIARGSNGTVVFEGAHEGRPAAVKRLVRACNDIATKEIQNLILSDRHPNIVRWYGVEQDQDFVYLALERCACSLNDLVVSKSSSRNPASSSGRQRCYSESSAEFEIVHLEFMNGFMQEFELWNRDGSPRPLLFKLMRDVICGVAHLHELGIIHRDLKPQNVLITDERSLSAKLSDMGISKRLIGDVTSSTCHATGRGTSGWQAPEQLLHERQTRAVDLFSLGCLLFFCITGGEHPFGNALERDINISKNKFDLFLVEHIPEAADIISRLLNPVACERPSAGEVLRHPLFWNAETRLLFLRDCSDRLELEDMAKTAGSDLLKSLESIAPVALGGGGRWSDRMEAAFLDNVRRYRKYRFDSVRDLLRVIRNKMNHYGELPPEIQNIIGGFPEGFDAYFGSRFPGLLIHVYKVMFGYCCEEEGFLRYFHGS